MTNMLNYLNNKKTNIGMFFALFAMGGQEVVVDIWAFNPYWMAPLIETLQWAAAAFGIVGLGHKGMKAMGQKTK